MTPVVEPPRLALVWRTVAETVAAAAVDGGWDYERLIQEVLDEGQELRITRQEAIEVLGLSGWAVNEILQMERKENAEN